MDVSEMTIDSVEITVDPLEKAKKKLLKELSFERMRVSFERLQLAWLRSAITFIALGFTAYTYNLSRIEDGKDSFMNYLSGREIGILFVVIGFVGLFQATFQHRNNEKKLRGVYPDMHYSVSLIQSYFVLFFTVLLLIAMIFYM